MSRQSKANAVEDVAQAQILESIEPEPELQEDIGTLFSLQGPGFEDLEWSIHRYRTRAEMAQDTVGDKTEWVLDVSGELRGTELLPQLGGGTFRFMGYVRRPGGVKLKYNRTITLGGPRKNFAEPPVTVTVSPTPPVSPAPDALLVKLLERMDARQERLEQQVAARNGDSDITKLVGALGALDQLRGRPESGGGLKDANAALDLIQKGIDIGTEREPIPTEIHTTAQVGAEWVPLLEKALDMAGRFVAARSQAAAQAAAQGRSHATVVEEPAPARGGPTQAPPAEPAAASSTPEQPSHRWVTAVEALAGAIANDDDPADFADLLERILAPHEFAMLKFATADHVFQHIAPALDELPILRQPQARVFVIAMLSAIQNPPAETD